MPLLRLLIIVLVLFNLLALAAGQGWLGTSETRGEPERLTNQINPDAIVLKPARPDFATTGSESEPAVTPATLDKQDKQERPATAPASPPAVTTTASAPVDRDNPPPVDNAARTDNVPDTPVCYAYTLPQPEADELEKALRSASHSLVFKRETVEPANTWWVRIPPFESRQRAEKRMRELRELGVTDLFVVREPGANKNAISLGLFRTESSARQHQSDLASKRIRDTEIIPRNPAVQRLEIRGGDTTLTPLTERLGSERPLLSRSPCPQP